jgi:2-octaprenyl-6-methoxyphenol hydroxylase
MNSNFSELPSEVVIADKLAKNRVILVGESAHVFPPLGAQGLNLGIRDIKELYSLLAQNRDINPGSKVITNKYNEQRWLDVYKRHKSVNLLYNSMMENKTRYKILRNIGLQSLNKSKILRKILLSQGMVIEKKK